MRTHTNVLLSNHFSVPYPHKKSTQINLLLKKIHVDKCGPTHKINFNNLTLDIHVKKTQ
jgi:hypothetical protein